jgi:hypothetical protein
VPAGVARSQRGGGHRTHDTEQVWQFLRANFLSNRVFETYEEIIDAACDAWNRLIALPATITSIGMREWAYTGRLRGPLVLFMRHLDLFAAERRTVGGAASFSAQLRLDIGTRWRLADAG